MTQKAVAGLRESILIVDDTLANLQLLTNMLREQGYHVRGAPKQPAAPTTRPYSSSYSRSARNTPHWSGN